MPVALTDRQLHIVQSGEAAKEYEIAWRADFERVAHQRDELAEGLRTRYPALATELMSLLDRIPAIDKEIGHLNAHAPPAVRDCHRGVKQTARGIERFAPSGWPGLLSLVTDMMLPKFETDGDRYRFSWPRPQPSLAEQVMGGLAVAHNPLHTADWHDHIDARNEERRKDMDCMGEFYANQEAEKERRGVVLGVKALEMGGVRAA